MNHRTLLSTARLTAVALGVAGLALPGPAAADTKAPLYAKMKQRFTTTKPGAWTGWRFDGGLKPFKPGTQVPAQRSATFVFPRGTRFDLSRIPNCSATDEEIMSEGIRVCPEGSQFLSGRATLFLGAAGIVEANLNVFVARTGFVVVFSTDGGAVLRALRGSVNRNRVNVVLPAVPLPGGYEVSVTSMSLKAPRAGTRRHPGLRTPPKCPRSGRWTFTYLPRYDAPHGVQRSTSSTPCERERR
jgi:hypothetical protein